VSKGLASRSQKRYQKATSAPCLDRASPVMEFTKTAFRADDSCVTADPWSVVGST